MQRKPRLLKRCFGQAAMRISSNGLHFEQLQCKIAHSNTDSFDACRLLSSVFEESLDFVFLVCFGIITSSHAYPLYRT